MAAQPRARRGGPRVGVAVAALALSKDRDVAADHPGLRGGSAIDRFAHSVSEGRAASGGRRLCDLPRVPGPVRHGPGADPEGRRRGGSASRLSRRPELFRGGVAGALGRLGRPTARRRPATGSLLVVNSGRRAHAGPVAHPHGLPAAGGGARPWRPSRRAFRSASGGWSSRRSYRTSRSGPCGSGARISTAPIRSASRSRPFEGVGDDPTRLTVAVAGATVGGDDDLLVLATYVRCAGIMVARLAQRT